MPAAITPLTGANNIFQMASKTNELVTRINTHEASLAANSYVNAQLADKANTSYVDIRIAQRPTIDYLANNYTAINNTEEITGSWSFKNTSITFNNSPILASNGTASLPSIRNSSDTDTGIWFGTNAVNISANGANVLQASSTAITTFRYSHYFGQGSGGGPVELVLGKSRASSGQSRLDLVGDSTYTDYGLRVQRHGSSTGNSAITHRGTGTLKIEALESAPLDISISGSRRFRLRPDGGVVVGTSSGGPAQTLNLSRTITGNTVSYGIINQGTVASDVTSWYSAYASFGTTENLSYTLGEFYHFVAGQGSWGGLSTVTTQGGFYVQDMTKGTNRRGFIGSLSHGANRFNLYMDGTARNYLRGNTAIGTNEFIRLGSYGLSVNGSINITGNFYRNGVISPPAVLNANNLFTKAQRIAVATLTDAPTITPNFNDSNHFYLNLRGNRILANPLNMTAGQSGVIEVRQANTGSKTLSFGSAYKFVGNAAPVLSTAQNVSDWLHYYVSNTSTVFVNLNSGTIKPVDNKLWFIGHFPYRLDLYGTQRVITHMPYAGRINNFIYRLGFGAITISVRINGVTVTGLSALAVSTTKQTTAATGLNTFNAGDYVELVFSANASSDSDFEWELECTRT